MCIDVSYTGVWCREGCVLGWVQAERQGVCVHLGVMCVCVGGAVEGEGSWAASLSSLDRALEKI